jgi:hypothetical protein
MNSHDDLPTKHWRGRVLDARLQLLDRQIHDNRNVPIGTVDDISLDGPTIGEDIAPGARAPLVTGLVSGRVLATRIFGGRPPPFRLTYIDWGLVETLGTIVKLRVNGEEFDSMWLENWLRRHIVGRIPGGRHAPE